MEEISTTSEMSEPESSNPFEALSDDPILHICSFLPGADLLKLSTVDRNFKRIITESTETMSKFHLMVNFEKDDDDDDDLDLDFAIKLAQTRPFTALKLILLNELTDAKAKVKLISLLELLSGSVDDLIVVGLGPISNIECPISQELLSSIIAMFLPNLKKCTLEYVSLEAAIAPIIEEISPQNNVNHTLQSLELIETHAAKVLQFFTGCNKLKTFRYDKPSGIATSEDIEQMNNFLATQGRLEKLVHVDEGLEWNRLKCFKLKELEVSPLPEKDDELAAAEFLKMLPSLAKLDICVHNCPCRRLMEEICGLPKLQKFTIRTFQDEDQDDDEDSLEGLVNHTVKELHIMDTINITSKLLKIFLGAESVYLCVSNDLDENLETVLDLSDVPCETIMKIKQNKDYPCSRRHFVVKFSPCELPTNVEQFESALMKFAELFSKWITGIEIGHESWHNSDAFELSNSFCEELVNRLPELRKLEIYNIADRGRFIAFLCENKHRLGLEEVKLHEPNGAGEPKPKKMKIEID